MMVLGRYSVGRFLVGGSAPSKLWNEEERSLAFRIRMLLWSEMRGRGTSTIHLRASDPALAERFAAVNRNLDMVTMSAAQIEKSVGTEELVSEAKGQDDCISRGLGIKTKANAVKNEKETYMMAVCALALVSERRGDSDCTMNCAV